MKKSQHSLLLIYCKRKEGEPLTEEEQRVWEEYKEHTREELLFDEEALARFARYQEKMTSWEQFKQKYHIEFPMVFPNEEKQPVTVQSIRRWPTYRFLTVAASLVGVILAGLGWFLSHDKGMDETATQTAATTTITPGSTKATLSLVDGQNRLGVPAGGEYSIELPDGTKVWLNAASAFRYPVAFGNSARVVELEEGEAFFEVAKKTPAQPFIVLVKGQKIEVLGTRFNINAYKDEPAVTTTLIEGSVSLTNGQQQKFLKPGQQAVTSTKGITIQKATSIEDATAWKHKYFSFHNERLSVIMAQVQRWYDVEVIYEDPLSDEQFVINDFPRSDPLQDLLKVLEITQQVRFRRDGRKVYICK
jgi:hypothetical protein